MLEGRQSPLLISGRPKEKKGRHLMAKRHSRSMEANVEHNGAGTCCPKKGENLWLRTASYCLHTCYAPWGSIQTLGSATEPADAPPRAAGVHPNATTGRLHFAAHARARALLLPPPPMGRAGRAPLPLKRWSSCSASSSRTCCRWPAAPLRARPAPCLRAASERASRAPTLP